jgi:hypothetical protein
MAPTPTGRQEPPIPTFELGQLLCLLWYHSVALTILGALGRPRCGGADDMLEFLGARVFGCASSPGLLGNLPSFSKSFFCGDQIVDCEVRLMSLLGNLLCLWGSSLAKSRPSITGGQTLIIPFGATANSDGCSTFRLLWFSSGVSWRFCLHISLLNIRHNKHWTFRVRASDCLSIALYVIWYIHKIRICD